MANEQPAYTIDELAVLTGVPSRTIRFYQAKGVLPAPERRGRMAFYGARHAARLRTIAELQDRGLRLRAIRDLLAEASRRDIALSEWLGLGERLQQPWSEEVPELLTEPEVEVLLKDRPPGSLAALVRAGILERDGPSYLVRSPGLLRIALQLDDAGVDFDTAAGAERIVRRRLSRAADDLVDYFADVLSRFEGPADLDAMTRALDALRPLSTEAVRLIFAQEIERAIRQLLERGLPKGGSRSRRGARR